MRKSEFENFSAIAERVLTEHGSNQSTAAEIEAYERGLEAAELDGRRHALAAAGVPARVRDTLRSVAPSSSLERVRRWGTSERAAWCLVLSGRPGCGKSTAAGWCVLQSVDPGVEARRWASVSRIMTSDRYRGEIEKLASARVLVIDDLGSEYADKNGNFTERLDFILTEREHEYRRTLITTNLNAQAFAERYSARIMSRLAGAAPLGGFYEDVGPDLSRST